MLFIEKLLLCGWRMRRGGAPGSCLCSVLLGLFLCKDVAASVSRLIGEYGSATFEQTTTNNTVPANQLITFTFSKKNLSVLQNIAVENWLLPADSGL